jgi:hypothetical protein
MIMLLSTTLTDLDEFNTQPDLLLSLTIKLVRQLRLLLSSEFLRQDASTECMGIVSDSNLCSISVFTIVRVGPSTNPHLERAGV